MSTNNFPYRLDRTAFQITTLEEQGNDLAYWQSKTPQERLAAGEALRQLHYGYDPTDARLQRVLTIVERP